MHTLRRSRRSWLRETGLAHCKGGPGVPLRAHPQRRDSLRPVHERPHRLQHQQLVRRVEERRELVEEEDPGRLGEGAREPDALLLPAGEGGDGAEAEALRTERGLRERKKA